MKISHIFTLGSYQYKKQIIQYFEQKLILFLQLLLEVLKFKNSMNEIIKNVPHILCQEIKPGQELLNLNDVASHQKQYYEYIKCVGTVRGEWFKPNGKLKNVCYGSGIAISKRIILTCAHCVYNEKKRTMCESVTFIPTQKKASNINKRVYKSAKQQFLQLQPLLINQTFSKYPIPQDVALIYLSQDLQLDSFPNVGISNEGQLEKGLNLLISGFPSLAYYTETSLQQIQFQRHSLVGDLLSVEGNTLYHNLPTQTGHSGSSIYAINANHQEGAIIGVHTHKGSKRNMGIFLTNALLKKLAFFQIKFGLFHKEYQINIKFPNSIKEMAYNQLTTAEKNIIKTKKQHLSINQHSIQHKSIKISQKKQTNSVQISKRILLLLEENLIRKKDLFDSLQSHNSKSQQILLKWLQIQNKFLLNFPSQTKKLQSSYLFQTIQNLLNNFQAKLQQIRKPCQLKVVYSKFPTVQSHLNMISFINQTEEIQLSKKKTQQPYDNVAYVNQSRTIQGQSKQPYADQFNNYQNYLIQPGLCI